MTSKWKLIYDMMLRELDDTVADGPVIEKCFTICNYYLTDIRSVALDPDEQIYFNKAVLPFFIAEAEYYSLLSFTQLFRPSRPQELVAFWLREGERFSKFSEMHRGVLDYVAAGQTYLDKKYFGDGANNTVTILSGYYSLRKYDKYVKEELKKITMLGTKPGH